MGEELQTAQEGGEKLKILPVSHLDHGLTSAHVQWLLARFAERDGFFIETVTLPDELAPLMSGIHGPIVGDAPVGEAEVWYAIRGDRAYASRLCSRAPRETRQMTVIAGPHEAEKCVLYTAYGGPLACREPGDPSVTDPADKAKSEAFWAEHALSAE